VTPQQLPLECRAASRSRLVPLDHRLLGGMVPKEHVVGVGDVLGIYVADVLGKREELPAVLYPHYRIRNAPTEPFVGQPIKVEADGTIQLPYVPPITVDGLTLQEVRNSIRHQYSIKTDLVKPGRDNTVVTLITPRFCRIHVFRQDTRYNVPGLQRPEQFEISTRWAGTILYLEPKEATVITALLQTGGLPGIDARNEIWVMKRVSAEEASMSPIPLDEKIVGNLPMMFPKENTKLIRIPLHVPLDKELPFNPEDVVLGDGDVVFLPRRDGDVFLTGGLLGGGRFPLARDRDIDILEAIAIATGNPLGPVGDTDNVVRFRSGPGNVVPPTDAVVVRRLSETRQFKIRVDLRKALDDPTERLIIAPGDLILLNYRPKELAGNVILNLFDYNFALTRSIN
jgi:protein involved in polysaccharide export with SLBB domain